MGERERGREGERERGREGEGTRRTCGRKEALLQRAAQAGQAHHLSSSPLSPARPPSHSSHLSPLPHNLLLHAQPPAPAPRAVLTKAQRSDSSSPPAPALHCPRRHRRSLLASTWGFARRRAASFRWRGAPLQAGPRESAAPHRPRRRPLQLASPRTRCVLPSQANRAAVPMTRTQRPQLRQSSTQRR